MFRNNRRALLLAVLVMLLGLSVAQAETAPWTPVGTIVRPFCNITVIGVGETSAEALSNALAQLKADYLVFSYRVVRSRCDTTEIPDPTPLDPFATQEVTICWTELSACGIRKAVVITNL
jgi:hypothetical protein